MAAVLAELDPTLLVSSDLARARETAAFLEKATGLTAVEDPRCASTTSVSAPA